MAAISKNFQWSEFEHTDNPAFKYKNMVSSVEVRDNLLALVGKVLQPLRDLAGEPLRINSGYRCPELNAAVGGVPTSQHIKGEAADVAWRFNPIDLAQIAKDAGLPFDQMIVYPTFVHFSHKRTGQNRGQILYNYRYKGRKLK